MLKYNVVLLQLFLNLWFSMQVGFTSTLTFRIQKYLFDFLGVYNQLITTSYARFKGCVTAIYKYKYIF